MGKKTFEEIGKIILVSIISILISTMATRRVLLDSKLDKVDYYRDQDIHQRQHKIEQERAIDTYNMVKFLYENEIKKVK